MLARSTKRFAVGLAALIALAAGAGSARADKMTDAEELFRRAKALMAQGKQAEACPLFQESERLDPQMGTLLNLAICHEEVGKIATAWGEFRAVEQMAKVANREDRAKLAQERALRLEPRLSRVKITLEPGPRPPGYLVKVDGEEKGEPLWGGVAVDPGTRTIEVSATHKKPRQIKVRVEDEAVTVPVTLPVVLEDAPIDDRSAEEREARLRAQYAANKSRRNTGFVIGGIGIATMAAGGVFGLLAIGADSDAHSACSPTCEQNSNAARTSDSATDRALVFANVANVAVPLGAIVTAVGAWFVFGAGPTKAPANRASLVPRLQPHAGGAGLHMSW